HIVENSGMDGYTYRTSCAVETIMNSDSKNLISLLRSQNFSDYSCREFYFTWFFEEKMREKIKKLKLDSDFPELHEESYLYEHE
ncbi:ankyrin repeat domain-containing protein, partial [Leptospira interrogans serovar Pomona]|nr:ankyrin repeat domain-containing protein [Leptospira interrogans serovar Pomona]